MDIWIKKASIENLNVYLKCEEQEEALKEVSSVPENALIFDKKADDTPEENEISLESHDFETFVQPEEKSEVEEPEQTESIETTEIFEPVELEVTTPIASSEPEPEETISLENPPISEPEAIEKTSSPELEETPTEVEPKEEEEEEEEEPVTAPESVEIPDTESPVQSDASITANEKPIDTSEESNTQSVVFKNPLTNLLMTYDPSKGKVVMDNPKENSQTQRWNLIPVNDLNKGHLPLFYIRNQSTGEFLVFDNYQNSNDKERPSFKDREIITAPLEKTAEFQWLMVPIPPNTTTDNLIIINNKSKLVCDIYQYQVVPGTKIIQYTFRGGNNQLFSIGDGHS